jgi:hypothetical protein|tara:strand:+ start:112 stop:555 length:444 start_codon:yes stop_codon:yes gene_type:complete
MGIIKPTFSLTSNASTATTDAGPLTVALSLSATDSLNVTRVESKIIDVDGTHGVLFDASDYYTAALGAGSDGGFVYVKNHDSAGHIYIGHGSSTALEGGTEATRIMTLLPGEFAFFPWDFTADLIEDANGTYTGALEAWLFIRTTTD